MAHLSVSLVRVFFPKIIPASLGNWPMAGKSKTRVSRPDRAKDLWINPRSNLRGPDGDRAWQNEGNISPSTGSRLLELADMALGLKKPLPKKKKVAAATHNRTDTS